MLLLSRWWTLLQLASLTILMQLPGPSQHLVGISFAGSAVLYFLFLNCWPADVLAA